MPRNKRPQDREEKRAEIIAAARALFIARGYEATPIGAIAAAAGVAPNTIYWYFGDKDDLLIAVLDGLLAEALAEYQNVTNRAIGDRLAWTVERLQPLRMLVTAVHARTACSPAVEAWHRRFHTIAEGLLEQEIAATHLPGPARDAEIRIGVFTVEGLIMHPLAGSQQRQVCDALAARWTARPLLPTTDGQARTAAIDLAN